MITSDFGSTSFPHYKIYIGRNTAKIIIYCWNLQNFKKGFYFFNVLTYKAVCDIIFTYIFAFDLTLKGWG